MKILNVSNTIDPVKGGGEAERSFQMSKFLTRSGADCRVLTIDTGLSAERKEFLGEGKVVALPCIVKRFYIPKFSFRVINEMVAEADIVHLMGHWNFLNALVYLAIRKQKKPYVVCPAGALNIFGRSKLIKLVYNLIVGKRIIRNASRCIAVTLDEKQAFISYGVKENKITVIPNGVAQSDFLSKNNQSFRLKYGLGERPFILFLGRINLIKGPDLLLKAFCRLSVSFPDIDLVFVGPDGGMLQELMTLAQLSGVARKVHYIGYLGGVEKSEAYHAAMLLVIPSRHEAMSIVALEAGICGTPVLLTDQCGFNQLSEIGGGWIVSASVDGLEQGLTKVLSHTELLKPAGLSIKKYVADFFIWEVVINSYFVLYRSLIKSSGQK